MTEEKKVSAAEKMLGDFAQDYWVTQIMYCLEMYGKAKSFRGVRGV